MMTTAERETLRGRFVIATKSGNWGTIEELQEVCDAKCVWDDLFLAGAVEKAKRSEIRRLVCTIKDSDGFPAIASVVTRNEAGKLVRVYKQEKLFDVDDYRQVVDYHASQCAHHRVMAKGYAKRCRQKHNKTIPLNFSE